MKEITPDVFEAALTLRAAGTPFKVVAAKLGINAAALRSRIFRRNIRNFGSSDGEPGAFGAYVTDSDAQRIQNIARACDAHFADLRAAYPAGIPRACGATSLPRHNTF